MIKILNERIGVYKSYKLEQEDKNTLNRFFWNTNQENVFIIDKPDFHKIDES